MKIKNTFLWVILLAFSACKHQTNTSNSPTLLAKELSPAPLKAQNLPLLDTTIVLSDNKDSYLTHKNLSEKEAERLLYKYFERKGVRTRKELIDISFNSNDRLCVDYDTIYPLQTNKFSGAIISYWLGPADLNGHCFRPSKAIILHKKNGYKLTNEEFIPSNFVVDSLVQSNIYGYDYECGGRGMIRYLKVRLE